MSVFVAICGYLNWRNAAEVADYVQDHDLLSSAKVLSDRLIWEDEDVKASVPPSALSLFVSPERDRVFLSVTGANGEVLAGSADFPLPAVRKPEGIDRAQWYDTRFAGVPLRATFIIDPENVIQHITVNGLNVGRNPAETLRIVDALQTDELCPCNWTE
eukprot:gene7965-10777_t